LFGSPFNIVTSEAQNFQTKAVITDVSFFFNPGWGGRFLKLSSTSIFTSLCAVIETANAAPKLWSESLQSFVFQRELTDCVAVALGEIFQENRSPAL